MSLPASVGHTAQPRRGLRVDGPAVVAMGGGHGLAVSLSALRGLTERLTAVVCMADNGGSSGRLRDGLGVPPPGDLRMALAALCGDDAWGRTWSRVVQHRFSDGDVAGHVVGNLLIAALWEQSGDLVAALDWMGALLGAHGRVLPVATRGLDIVAAVRGIPGAPEVCQVRGQAQVAVTTGVVERIRLEPAAPDACPEAVAAIGEADALVMGPGSWYTSVIANLLVPGINEAFQRSAARKVLVLNLVAQKGETSGFSPQGHLAALHEVFPGLRFDVVLADPDHVPDRAALGRAAGLIDAELVLRRVSDASHGPGHHDPRLLGVAFADLLGHGRIPAWR
jgi:uncharacterized cofD-like protein